MPKKEKKSEESDNLEEQVKKQVKNVPNVRETIDETKFEEFFQSSRQNIVPILEKVKNRDINLEKDIEPVETPAKNTREQRQPQTNYSSFAEEVESRSYQTGQPPVLMPVERSGNSRTQAGLIDPLRGRGIEQDNMQPRMIETGISNEDRRLPFERDDRKYKEVKFKKFV